MNAAGSGLFVGNDIVDLRARRIPDKSRDIRFVRKIFAPEEQARILSSDDPDRELWTAWAAKEAAFKVVSKTHGKAPVFSHARFLTRTRQEEAGGGIVLYEDASYPFRVTVDSDRIHVLSWSPGYRPDQGDEIATGEAAVGTGTLSVGRDSETFNVLLLERFTARERRSIRGVRSAYVRLLARRAVAESLSMDEARLELICGSSPTGRIPPQLLMDGEPSGIDVSLSHHGQFVAWAFVRQTH